MGWGHIKGAWIAVAMAALAIAPAAAQDAAWLASPVSGDFNAGTNWDTNAVPTGIATFNASSQSSLTFSADTTVGGFVLNGPTDYTFDNNGRRLTFNDFGIDDFFANATLITSNGGTTIFGGDSTAGNARLVIDAGSVVDFSPSTGFFGVSAGSIEGAGNIYLGANELVVGGNNLSTTFSGVISDCGPTGNECQQNVVAQGALTKIGTGTLTLTGHNTYTGDTNIDDGTLLVNGSLWSGGIVFVNPATTLGGTGSVGLVLLDNGATLAPGTPTSIGTLTAEGVLFCSCTIFSIKVWDGAADKLVVNGSFGPVEPDGLVTATFAGTTIAKRYTILSAAGGVDTSFVSFTGLNDLNTPTGFTASLDYDANNVYLQYAFTPLPLDGLNANQRNVLNGAVNAFNAGSAIPIVFGAITPAGLTQLSGEAATGGAAAGLQNMGSFLALITNPFGGAGGNGAGAPLGFATAPALSPEAASAYAAVTPKDRLPVKAPPLVAPVRSVWGAAFGGSTNADGDPGIGSHDLNARTWGLATGFEQRISADLKVGAALAGGGTSWGLGDGLGNGKSDTAQFGVYGLFRRAAAYLSGALSYAWHGTRTERTALGEMLTADFDAHSFGGRIEAGYRFVTPVAGVTPYAALQGQSFRTPAYSEQGGALALAYQARTTTNLRTELGSWIDHAFVMRDGTLVTLRGRAAWAHNEVSDPSLVAAFQATPGSDFTVTGAALAPDAALLSAAVEVALRGGWSVAAKFDGEFAAQARTYAGTGRVRYTW